jgi:D-proline reductase (dithiol) PrdB
VQPHFDQLRPHRVAGRLERPFPIDRLRELAAEGTIGSMADTHYSFMGATDPLQMEPHARELAGRLKQEDVDSVLLAPV